MIENKIDKYTYSNEHMLPYCFSNNGKSYDILAVKANMGVGKSENLKYLINQYQNVVIVSFRISLNKQFTEKFSEFELYLDIHETIYHTKEHNKIVIQIDSFNKIRGNIDLLIIDEVTYTMSQLVHSKKMDDNFEALKQYLNNKTTKCILLDALLEDDTLNVFKLFNRNILFIENEFKKHEEKKIICYNNDYGLFKKNILKDIENNKKIVIATNSKAELDFLESQLNEKFGKSKTFSFITSDNPEYYVEDWKYLDVLGYTPTISAGVSYTEKHFDKIYGYFVNGSANAEIAVQQLFRIRNLNENEINICVDITNGDKFPTNDDELDDYIINRNKILCDTIDFVKIDYIKNDIKKDEYYYWYKSVIKKEYLSNNNYMKRILELFNTQGIKNIKYTGNKNIDCDKEARKIKKQHAMERNEQLYKDICNSYKLTFDEYQNIEKKIKKTKEEKYSCKRFKFLNQTKLKEEQLTPEVYKKYFRNIPRLNNLAYLYESGENIIKKLNTRFNYTLKQFNKNNNVMKLHESKRFEKMLICLDIINQYGFDISNILNYKEDDYIKLNKIKIKEYILKNHINIDYAFGLASKNWKKLIDEDNWFTHINRYINARLNSMFRLTLRIKKINKIEHVYINGLNYWNEVKYDNLELITEINEIETKYYIKIDEEYKDYEFNEKVNKFKDKGMDIFEAILKSL